MNNNQSVRVSCPHCPGSTRSFSEHGLKIHIGRVHKSARGASVTTQAGPDVTVAPPAPDTTMPNQCPLDRLARLRECTPVLRHVPKGARHLAAEKLCDVIDMCVDRNGVEEWSALLSYAFTALRVPLKDLPGNMTAKVKANVMSSGSELGDGLDIEPNKTGLRSKKKYIESKVFEGDLRGAVRLLMSDDTFADRGPETLAALKQKHPAPSRPLNFPPEPDLSFTALSVNVEDVISGIGSFYSGSAAGLDGLRPGHLKELTSASAGENGRRLLGCLAKLVNFLLSGQLNPVVCPYLYGASLCALDKKDGGVRPIAVGSVFRRLAAKLACRAVKDDMAAYLQPHQLGFGTPLGCEAAIHATRTFVMNPLNADNILLKLDIRNAFNSLERDVLLSEAKEKIPSLFPFLHQVYRTSSNLYFKDQLISSEVGAQQGDPLGPLVFGLAIHKVLLEIKSSFNVWYLDDGTIGGKPEEVLRDLEALIPRLQVLGLEVNPSKCEFFPCSTEARTHFSCFNTFLPGIKEISPSNFNLLGSPIFVDAAPQAVKFREQLLLSARERLEDLSAHVAIVLLRMCFGLPKINYLLRTTPTWLCTEEVTSLDMTLKSVVESVLNVSLGDRQWDQASLPVRSGGLGIRRACDVGLPAFLASAHGVASLVTVLVSDGDEVCIPHVSDARSAWAALNSGEAFPENAANQRAWDDVGVKRVQDLLLEGAIGADKARLRAVSQPESGAWLHALPSPHLGTLLDDDSLRVAVALRLGCKVCEPHVCTCGSMVEADGHHALSCRRCTGRFSRHHALNDIVRRALISANVPCVLEPPGLSRSDGKTTYGTVR